MIKTAIYIRVSTDRQKEGDSVPAQRAALYKYIEERTDLILEHDSPVRQQKGLQRVHDGRVPINASAGSDR